MRSKLLAIVSVLTLGLIGWSVWKADKIEELLMTTADQLQQQPEPMSYSYKSGGGTVTATVYQKEGETEAAAAARLKAKVDALKAVFPPDPQ
jgi:hypothetical protein